MIYALLFWLILQLLALLALPLAARLFRWLPDRGYTFAKMLGLLVISYIVWLGASAHLLYQSKHLEHRRTASDDAGETHVRRRLAQHHVLVAPEPPHRRGSDVLGSGRHGATNGIATIAIERDAAFGHRDDIFAAEARDTKFRADRQHADHL